MKHLALWLLCRIRRAASGEPQTAILSVCQVVWLVHLDAVGVLAFAPLLLAISIQLDNVTAAIARHDEPAIMVDHRSRGTPVAVPDNDRVVFFKPDNPVGDQLDKDMCAVVDQSALLEKGRLLAGSWFQRLPWWRPASPGKWLQADFSRCSPVRNVC